MGDAPPRAPPGHDTLDFIRLLRLQLLRYPVINLEGAGGGRWTSLPGWLLERRGRKD